MFISLLHFEVGRVVLTRAFWIFFGFLAAILFALVHVFAGMFDLFGVSISHSFKLNDAMFVRMMMSMVQYLSILIVAAITHLVAMTEFDNRAESLSYTTGVSKVDYLVSKLLAVFILSSLLMTAPLVGHALASFMPYLDQSFFGPFNIIYYLDPFVKVYLPNLAFFSMLFMGASFLSRKNMVNLTLTIGLYLFAVISSKLHIDPDTMELGALIDPFAQKAIKMSFVSMGSYEKGQSLIDVSDLVIYNRIIWFTVTALVFVVSYRKFNFQLSAHGSITNTRLSKWMSFFGRFVAVVQSKLTPNRLLARGILFELHFLVFNRYFLLFIIACGAVVAVSSQSLGHMSDTTTYPLTYMVTEMLASRLSPLVYLFLAFMAGELLAREKLSSTDEMMFTLPVPHYWFLITKGAALLATIALINLIMVGFGLTVQITKGYYQFELSQYLTSLFFFEGINQALVVVLALAVHHLVGNRYIALFLLVAYFVALQSGLKLSEHHLTNFGQGPGFIYSTLNGYGNYVYPYFVFKLYWLLFGLTLLAIAHLFWSPVILGNAKTIYRHGVARFKRSPKLVSSLAAATGTYALFILYNTHVLNPFQTFEQRVNLQVDYEKLYKSHADIAQPTLTKMDVSGDIFPEDNLVSGTVTYHLENETSAAIDALHLDFNDRYISEVSLSPGIDSKLHDDEHRHHQYQLKKALLPGESMELTFNYQIQPKGFSNQGVVTPVVQNGTFFNPVSYFPRLGYQSEKELSSATMRAKHGLEEKPLAADRNDEEARYSSLITPDGDYVELNVTLSTVADQIAIAPGNLVKQWNEGDRAYFQYKPSVDVLPYISILSAKYEQKSLTWQPPADSHNTDPVELSVLYHPEHEYNVDAMLRGMKASLDYFTTAFSAYPHKQLRIVEFPRFRRFAQSFPATIPFSEGIGFISDMRDAEALDKIDYPFFVTAHEVAHQWWAHQVTSADTEGAQFIVESLSQYSAFKVMEKELGKEHLKRLMKREHMKYLASRGDHMAQEERPLSRVLNSQQPIFYQKGGLSLYGISDYIGEDNFNQALGQFVEDYAYQSEPFPTTLEFFDTLSKYVPKQYQYFVEDHLNKITFYETEIESATYERKRGFNYEVQLAVNLTKTYGDEKGKETEVNAQDWIEVGIYDKQGEEIYLTKHLLKDGDNTLTLNLKRKPDEVIIDPYFKVIQKGIFETKAQVIKKSTLLAQSEAEPGRETL